MLSILRNAAILFVAGTATASADGFIGDGFIADGFLAVPAPATALLFGAAAGVVMLVKAYRKRR